MYQELVQYPAGSKKGNFVLIAVIVLCVFVISLFSRLLSMLGLPGADLLAVAVVGVGACVVFMQRVVKFRYTLMEDDLIISRIVGDREKNVLIIDVDHLKSIGDVEKECDLPTERCLIPTKKLRKKQLIYTNNTGETVRAILQPSDKLLERIRIYQESKKEEQ